LAGLLIAGLGLSWSYLANALSFFPLILVLFGAPNSRLEAKREGVIKEALEGMRFVWGHPLVRQVVLLVGLSSLLGMNFQTMVPAYARLELKLDAQSFGLLMSAVGLGSIVAALIQALTSRARPLRAVLGSALLGLALMALALPLPTGWVAFIFGLAGLGMITTLINSNTTVQLLAPDRIRGRVMSVYSMVLLGTGPLGAYISGWLIDALGARFGVATMGLLTLLAALWMARLPWPRALTPVPSLEAKLPMPTPQAASD